MRLSLELYQPLPLVGQLDTIDVNPDVTQIQFSTALPGGFQGLTVGLWQPERPQYGYLPQPIERRGFAHVVLSAGSAIVWEGRLMLANMIGGEWVGFVAEGYGLSATTDNWYGAATGLGTTAGSVLRDIIGQCCPLLSIGPTYIDSGVPHTPAEFDGMYPNQVIDQLSKEGGGGTDNAPFDWAVWESRIASWAPRIAPPQPTYVIPADSTVSQQPDFHDVRGSVVVRYTPSGGTLTTTAATSSPDFLGLYGIGRSAILQASQVTAAGAAQFQETQRVLMAAPKVATKITRTGGRGLERPGGGETPGWLVRAGEWVQIAEQPASPIISTSYDANATDADGGQGRLELTVQAYPRGYLEQVRELLRVAAHTLNRTNAVSGAKLG